MRVHDSISPLLPPSNAISIVIILEKAFKCAHFTPEFLQLGPSLCGYPSKTKNFPVRCRRSRTRLSLIETFSLSTIHCLNTSNKSEMDAACQVHVWHVSRTYTIVSSSSLSVFIVLNFCPSLHIRWKQGVWFQLVNGCRSEGPFPESVCLG